jgi:hypothetical protein
MKLLSLLLVAVLVLMAQWTIAADMVEVVYLKNGSIIRGIIIEQIPGKSIKIQTEGGNVFVFTYDEIEKITKEAGSAPGVSSPLEPRSTGFTSLAKLGLMSGESETMFSITSISGAMLSEDVSLGLGLTYDNYPNGSMLPIFLDVRGYMTHGRVRPVLFADAGYSLGWIKGLSGSDWGGFMLNAGLGISVAFPNSRAAFVADVGYKLQKAKALRQTWGYYWDGYDYHYYYYEDKINESYDFFVLQAGFSF